MGGSEQSYIKEAFDTNWISTVGPQINLFEEKLTNYTKAKHVAALVSGTSAIHLALKILGVEPDDTVLTQSFTFAASAFPIIYLGAKPIFIDSEQNTWNMDPNVLEDALQQINKSPNQLPKAIMPVHLYGMPSKMEEINEVAAKYDIPVIEDAAEALGALYKNKPCGSLTEMGILSFNGNKIITTSGGGALLSNNEEYIKKAKFLATQARDNAPHYQHTQIGYNYRLGNVNAAIGLGQMEVLDERVKRKREIFNFYNDALADVEGISFQSEPKESFSNRWLTTILTPSFEQRETIRLALEKENIESRPLWKPMHLQPVFKEAQYIGGNVAENLFNKGLCLPSGTAMTESDLRRIVGIITKAYRQER
ncbi:MAG: DegT/DnrJ/EryC1/StrS family aminotransferase [Cyclobacteriaceae bacterium]|nr:DegT/DnrJ/EryC1/StrS family aminotransferase [Cyclobacteriaceae bacterium]